MSPKLIFDKWSSIPQPWKRYRERKKFAGLCQQCGVGKTEGRWACANCLVKHNERCKRYQQKQREANNESNG